MKKNMKKDILVMGFAMFAIFFGSGNLIFPPIIGLVSGEQVGWPGGFRSGSQDCYPGRRSQSERRSGSSEREKASPG